MIGDLFDSPWKILIIALVIIVLFGSKKLPSAARSLGQSMRILKREVQGLHEDEPESRPAGASGSGRGTCRSGRRGLPPGPAARLAALGPDSGHGHASRCRRGRPHRRRALRALPAAAESRRPHAAHRSHPRAAQPRRQDGARPGRRDDRRVHLLQPGLARHRAPAVLDRDPRALRLPHAGGQPAGPERPARPVLPAGEGRADRRGDPVLAGLAVPDLGVRRARPARQGKAVELPVPRRGHPAVRHRHHGCATCRWAGPCTTCSA